MSRATDSLEQDVGGGEGDTLPTYENLAQEHGPNSRYAMVTGSRCIALHSVFFFRCAGSAGGKAG